MCFQLGNLFHIDFGHILGNYKSFMGSARSEFLLCSLLIFSMWWAQRAKKAALISSSFRYVLTISPVQTPLLWLNVISLIIAGRLPEGLPGSETPHQPADHSVLHDADDRHASADQQGGHWVHKGSSDSRTLGGRGQTTLLGTNRDLPGQGLDGAVQLVPTLGARH